MDPSRRRILKLIAAAPLVLTFGSAANAMMRFAKPTMKPAGLFDPPDMPTNANLYTEHFVRSDFPSPWICLPFTYHMKIREFNAEQEVIREIPGFIVRLPSGEIVAYSRLCPYRGCPCLNFVQSRELKQFHLCDIDVPNPVLMCPCDLSTFDLANEARVIQGPATRPPRRFNLEYQGEKIVVGSLEPGCIW